MITFTRLKRILFSVRHQNLTTFTLNCQEISFPRQFFEYYNYRRPHRSLGYKMSAIGDLFQFEAVGHEGAGIVEKVGPAVTKVKPGH